jgi:transposase-like protein
LKAGSPKKEAIMQTEAILTPLQLQVLDRLTQGDSITTAAQTTGVHRNTIANWRREVPAFHQAIRERSLLAQEQLGELLPDAIEVLRTILHNESVSPSVRLRAALSIVKMAATKPEPEPAAQPEPAVRPALADAIEAKIHAVREEQNQLRQNLHNFAQQPIQHPIRKPAEPGRNSQCPCGSNLKYKRCCANKPLAA